MKQAAAEGTNGAVAGARKKPMAVQTSAASVDPADDSDEEVELVKANATGDVSNASTVASASAVTPKASAKKVAKAGKTPTTPGRKQAKSRTQPASVLRAAVGRDSTAAAPAPEDAAEVPVAPAEAPAEAPAAAAEAEAEEGGAGGRGSGGGGPGRKDVQKQYLESRKAEQQLGDEIQKMECQIRDRHRQAEELDEQIKSCDRLHETMRDANQSKANMHTNSARMIVHASKALVKQAEERGQKADERSEVLLVEIQLAEERVREVEQQRDSILEQIAQKKHSEELSAAQDRMIKEELERMGCNSPHSTQSPKSPMPEKKKKKKKGKESAAPAYESESEASELRKLEAQISGLVLREQIAQHREQQAKETRVAAEARTQTMEARIKEIEARKQEKVEFAKAPLVSPSHPPTKAGRLSVLFGRGDQASKSASTTPASKGRFSVLVPTASAVGAMFGATLSSSSAGTTHKSHTCDSADAVPTQSASSVGGGPASMSIGLKAFGFPSDPKKSPSGSEREPPGKSPSAGTAVKKSASGGHRSAGKQNKLAAVSPSALAPSSSSNSLKPSASSCTLKTSASFQSVASSAYPSQAPSRQASFEPPEGEPAPLHKGAKGRRSVVNTLKAASTSMGTNLRKRMSIWGS